MDKYRGGTMACPTKTCFETILTQFLHFFARVKIFTANIKNAIETTFLAVLRILGKVNFFGSIGSLKGA